MLASASALAVLAFIAWRTAAPSDTRPHFREREAVAPGERTEVELESLASAERGPRHGRASLALGDESPRVSAPPQPALRQGVVHDVEGNALAGLAVVRAAAAGAITQWPPADDVALATSGPEGEFTLPQGVSGELWAESPAWTTLIPANAQHAMPRIVCAPRRRFAGLAVDEFGSPLGGVALEIALDQARALVLQPSGAERWPPRRWQAMSGADGSFALGDVAGTSGLELFARCTGFIPSAIPLPSESRDDLLVRLSRPPVTDCSLRGVVVDGDGDSVAGAEVALEKGPRAESDATGDFSLEVPRGLERGVLWAIAPEHLPACLELDPLAAYTGTAPREKVRLVLGGAPLSIAGEVVDAQGSPVARARVFTWDLTYRNGHAAVESAYQYPGVQTVADDAGCFRLNGLLPRAYTLLALHPRTLGAARLDAVEAGRTDARIVLAGGERALRVAGRLLTPAGEPIGGAMIFFGRSFAPGIERLHAPLVTERVPLTDGQGAFAFEGLCVEGTYLLPAGGGIADQEPFYLDPRGELEALVLRASRVCRFQVLLESDPEEADAFAVLGGDGAVMRIGYELGDTSVTGNGFWPLAGGRSEVMQCDERAASLILRKAGAEVRRVPLQLRAGEIATLRL